MYCARSIAHTYAHTFKLRLRAAVRSHRSMHHHSQAEADEKGSVRAAVVRQARRCRWQSSHRGGADHPCTIARAIPWLRYVWATVGGGVGEVFRRVFPLCTRTPRRLSMYIHTPRLRNQNQWQSGRLEVLRDLARYCRQRQRQRQRGRGVRAHFRFGRQLVVDSSQVDRFPHRGGGVSHPEPEARAATR